MNDRPIREEDLHAFVDGRLDPARRDAVAGYLEGNPQEAARLAAYMAQRTALKAALDPIAQEPLPPRLDLERLTARGRERPFAWRSAAAALLTLGLGLAGGWMARGFSLPPQVGVGAIGREAAQNYRVYASDLVRPVEVAASAQSDLAGWISDRLKRPITAPDLSAAGYRLIGGRLVATPHGPAGLFLYEASDRARVALLVRPMAKEKTVRMSDQSNDGLGGVAWVDDGLGYGIVGAAPAERLYPVANEVRRQISSKPS